ncbi:insulinase family protein [Oceanispirochaeta crateris]|uniref:Insulinase family protein n=1 Tax=Oceanispirochaeta crateris TaxID=2518645 RepID=A0A5C1QTB9_9SPIO|nr:M16 family metallopeptidase [Oceanispirochaeta crateris]QEN09262.1 insulinase family protein [Oceanispirochaeta crateris]
MFLKADKRNSSDQINSPEDPYNLTTHTLSNGLTLYLSCRNHKPRIETRIVIKAGSAQDPEESTGAAHILEHLMFKGSESIGTLRRSEEKVLLEKISRAFESLREVEDEEERKKLFQKIDALNQKASVLSLPGEYDRILSHLGARGVNAYTSVNETVYKCDIPSIELERWISLESERFSRPVIRSFLTEIEAIFEEFNQDLDDDFSRARDLLLEKLFPGHEYGSHTILGKKEHIKAPSIEKIEEFRNTWYRPEHMALCLAGDFDREEALELIDRTWGKWNPPSLEKPLPGPRNAKPLRRSEKHGIKGADSEFTMTGFRFGGVRSEDYDPLCMLDLILSNSQAGLIDLNLVQKQKILDGGSSLSTAGDYSWFVLYGTPGPGQSLGSVHRLLLKQLDLIRKGEFDDRLLKGVIKFLEIEQTQDLESNQIVDAFADCFSEGISWSEYLNRLDRLKNLTAEDLIAFVKDKFNESYVRIDKKEGEDPAQELVNKPEITALNIDYNKESAFFADLRSRNPGYRNPSFPDYNRDLEHCDLNRAVKISRCANKKNDLFEVTFIFPEGKSSSPWLPIAGDYFPYLGTDSLSPDALQKEAFLLGIDLSIQVDLERTVFSLYGKDEDLEKALSFTQSLIRRGRGDRRSYRKYIQGLIKRRKDAKLSKKVLLFGGLYSWGLYGPDSPFRDIIAEKDLKSMDADHLTHEIRRLFDLPHQLFYYGTRSLDEVRTLLIDLHPGTGNTLTLRPKKKYVEKEGDGNVFFTNHDMVQAEVFRLAAQSHFRSSHLASITLFNEFFGAGLNSLFFQEIREARGLAYTAYSSISVPESPQNRHILSSYLGTQADKLPEALSEMERLFQRVPARDRLFEEARTALLKSQSSERIADADIFWSWWEAQELGLNQDYRQKIFHDLESYSYTMMEEYFRNSVIPVKNNILILGNRDELDLKSLEKRGPLYELDPDELFNY